VSRRRFLLFFVLYLFWFSLHTSVPSQSMVAEIFRESDNLIGEVIGYRFPCWEPFTLSEKHRRRFKGSLYELFVAAFGVGAESLLLMNLQVIIKVYEDNAWRQATHKDPILVCCGEERLKISTTEFDIISNTEIIECKNVDSSSGLLKKQLLRQIFIRRWFEELLKEYLFGRLEYQIAAEGSCGKLTIMVCGKPTFGHKVKIIFGNLHLCNESTWQLFARVIRQADAFLEGEESVGATEALKKHAASPDTVVGEIFRAAMLLFAKKRHCIYTSKQLFAETLYDPFSGIDVKVVVFPFRLLV